MKLQVQKGSAWMGQTTDTGEAEQGGAGGGAIAPRRPLL
jgi:hypothetical protein